MKTKKINIVRFTKPERTETEEEVIDKDYYIDKYYQQEKAKGTIIIEVDGGLVTDVVNIPDEKKYIIIDYDVYADMSDEEFKEEFKEVIE